MSGIVVYYFEFLFLALALFFLIRTIKRHGVGYIPGAVTVVLGLLMVLSRLKKSGIFNITYFIGFALSLIVVYLLIDLLCRKVFVKK